MCQYALIDQSPGNYANIEGFKTKPIKIFDAHNAVWKIVQRLGQNAPMFLKPLAYLEAQRIKRYEGMIVSRFEHTLAVSILDSQGLLEAADTFTSDMYRNNISITVIPIAVDTQELLPVNRISDSTNILTLGTLHYPPNADGVRWFLLEVFPIIKQLMPEASLTIIGKNPPHDFKIMEQQHPDSITVTSYVPDISPYLKKAGVMVVPVRAGGGMRVRILEAFARGIPVVTTTMVIEGIKAKPGEEVLIEDKPTEFTKSVVNLLNSREKQTKLATNGRNLAISRYDWKKVLNKMDSIYDNI